MPINYRPIPETPEFKRWWSLYPRKVSKGDAKKAWEQTESIRPPINEMVRALIVQRASDDWRRDGGIWVPYPASYLRAEKWDDAPEIEVDAVKDDHAWHESVSGIMSMGEKLGLTWDERGETFQAYGNRVRRAVSEKVTPIRKEMSA